VQPGARQVPTQVQVHHPRLHPGQASLGVDLQDPVHPGHDHHDRLVARHRAPGQPGTGAAGHECPAVGDRRHHTRRDLAGGLGKADHPGPPAPNHRRVPAVQAPGYLAYLDPVPVQGVDQLAYQWIR
ncbi:uncharacterized protein METZ01_LOCUS70524, partial [marine metagenome]